MEQTWEQTKKKTRGMSELEWTGGAKHETRGMIIWDNNFE